MPAPVTKSPPLNTSRISDASRALLQPQAPALEEEAPTPPSGLILASTDAAVEETMTIIRALTNQHNALVAKGTEDPTAIRDAKVLKKAAEIMLSRTFTPTLA